MSRRRTAVLTALAIAGLGGTAVATHVANDPEGHTTGEQTVRKKAGAGFQLLEIGPGEPYMVRETAKAKAQADREKRRRSLAYVSQMTDFQLADEESPTRVEFADPAASSAHRPQEGLTPFQVEATIRQINHFTKASPILQGDGTSNAMDFALLTGDQADNQHLNETVWVRDLLEGNGPLNFNSGVTDPSFYNPATLSPSCLLYLAQEGNAQAAAAEAGRYTGVQDYDDYPISDPAQPLYYDPDNPKGQFAGWPRYGGLLDRAQEIILEPTGLDVPFYITNGNHDVLVQGNEDANKAFEEIAVGCFKALGSTIQPAGPQPDPDLLLTPTNAGMLIAPDPNRRFVSKVEIKQLYGATDEGERDDDHGFKYVDPAENTASNGSASYYAWDPPQTPGMRFISIDTNSEGGQTAEGVANGSSNGNIDDPQFQWIKKELQAAKARNRMVVIFGHHPVRSMSTQIRDEQAAPCTVEDEHGHDVNPGCDIDPRPSDGDSCIHNGTDEQSNCPADVHESFEELIDQFPNVISYVPGHTHEHRLTPFTRTDGSTWWEINTSAVIDPPNQSRLVEWMDNRDGTLSIWNTVVDHAGAATAPAGCATGECAKAFDQDDLASIGRTLAHNDIASGTGKLEDRNAELLLEDPRPVSDLAISIADSPDPVVAGKPVTYTITVANGEADAHDVVVSGEVAQGSELFDIQSGACSKDGRRFTCRIAKLAASESGTVTVKGVRNSAGEIVVNARVSGNVSDRVAGNDADEERTKVDPAPPVEPTPDPSATPTPGANPTPTATPAGPGTPGYELPKPACVRGAAFTRADLRSRGRRVAVRIGLAEGASLARVDVFQSSSGRRVLGERLVARFRRAGSFTWNGRSNRKRRVRDGYFFVRLRAVDANGETDVRRHVLRRSRGRWSRRRAFEKRTSCGIVRNFKLERPVFGGSTKRSLRAAFRLNRRATVRVDVLRGRRVVRRGRFVLREAARTYRVRVDRRLRGRSDYRVRLTARAGTRREVRVLVSRRL